MSYSPRRDVDWQPYTGANYSTGQKTVRTPRVGGATSVDVYTEVLWVPAGNIVLSVGPSDGVLLRDMSIAASTEISVTTLDGASSMALYMSGAVPITAEGGTLQLVAFGGSYNPVGDSTGLTYDAEAQAIVNATGRMLAVRAVLALLNTAA